MAKHFSCLIHTSSQLYNNLTRKSTNSRYQHQQLFVLARIPIQSESCSIKSINSCASFMIVAKPLHNTPVQTLRDSDPFNLNQPLSRARLLSTIRLRAAGPSLDRRSFRECHWDARAWHLIGFFPIHMRAHATHPYFAIPPGDPGGENPLVGCASTHASIYYTHMHIRVCIYAMYALTVME